MSRHLTVWSVVVMLACAGTAAAQTIDFGNYHALLIANEKYEHWTPLETPHEDVADLEEILRERYGFKTKVIQDATRSQIVDELEALKKQLTERDNLLIYYAGHGKIRADGGYWIGVDAGKDSRSRWLHYRTIEDLLDVEAGMKARHVLLIADSCYSGYALRTSAEELPRKQPDLALAEWLQRMTQRRARMVMTSGGEQPVLDRVRKGRNSVFARELLAKLKRGDEVVEGNTLWGKIKLEVHHRAQRVLGDDAQVPEYGPIRGVGHDGGDFLFRPKNIRIAVTELETDQSSEFGIKGPVETQTVLVTPPEFELVPTDRQMVANTTSNVRSAPSVQAKKVGLLQAGSVVDVTGQTTVSGSTWYRVSLAGGGDGFVFGDLLKEAPARLVTPAVGTYPRKYEPRETFRDCADCPEMVVVPAGSFTMGSPEGEEGRQDDEGPQRRVEIPKALAVGKREVTFDQWQACLNDKGCNGYRPDDSGWGRGERPVINVSWDDAQTFIAWMNSKVQGNPYRLPTEAEWEYAVRAGTRTPFFFGRTITPAQANYDGNYVYNGGPKGRYLGKTATVGSYPANDFGFHDMHGNVWEWVEDCWNDSYSGAPTDGSAWTSGDCSHRVLRGGSWLNVPRFLRSANRDGLNTALRNNRSGFRVARTLP